MLDRSLTVVVNTELMAALMKATTYLAELL